MAGPRNSRFVQFTLEKDLDEDVSARMEEMGIASKGNAIKAFLRMFFAAVPKVGAERAAYWAAFMRARSYLFPRVGEFFAGLPEQLFADLRDMTPGDGTGSEIDPGETPP